VTAFAGLLRLLAEASLKHNEYRPWPRLQSFRLGVHTEGDDLPDLLPSVAAPSPPPAGRDEEREGHLCEPSFCRFGVRIALQPRELTGSHISPIENAPR